jgi:YidC/Oxa1 family membrane protein insertase
MDQEKRVMLAVGLSLVILLVLGPLLFPPKPSTTKPTPAPARPGLAQPPATAMPAPSPSAPAKLPVVAGTKAAEIVVESNLYRVTFSTQGAVVKSWVLKKYRDAKEDPLDVVNGPACEALGYPMSFNLANQELASRLNTAVYVPTPSGTSLQAPAKIEFIYSDGKVQAKKQFTFGPTYETRVEMSVIDGQNFLPVEVAWPGGFGDHTLAPATEDAASLAVYGLPDSLTTVAQKKVKEDQLIPGPLEIAGLEDHYFAGVFLPGSPDQAFRIGRRAWTPADWKGKDSDRPQPLIAMLASAQPKSLAFRLFVAPKDLDLLRSVIPPLDALVDFGFFKWFAKPLFLALLYIYDHWVHNYGWAIVILTVLINLAMFPLKLKSIKSAQEMQRIAPLVKDIQEKYKQYKFNDPRKQRMNQEVMKLYQEHHINPLGGCLPMALQMPFLYAFYSVLGLPIELRHAPWIWWVKDLSAPDRFHPWGIPLPILPAIMVITMFILQRMTPMATADPAQQRMMMIMPIVVGIMFFNLASGLVLYFLVANLVGIAQQALINKMVPRPQPPAPSRKAVKA